MLTIPRIHSIDSPSLLLRTNGSGDPQAATAIGYGLISALIPIGHLIPGKSIFSFIWNDLSEEAQQSILRG